MTADTRDAVRRIVEAAIENQPRSQQQTIGPSEIGIPCDRCLGHKLAGTPQHRDVAWLPYIGTAVHALFEQVFMAESLAADAAGRMSRWCPETKLHVGAIGGEPIRGSCDLSAVEAGVVVDFKIVGKTTLTTARIGPSEQYRVQAHLYGRGWQLYGHQVNDVAIWYLPRNATTLDAGIWWSEPYDETVATAALTRADALARGIRLAGADVVLPQLARTPGCWDCPRFPAYPTDSPLPTRGVEPFADLVGRSA